MNDCSFLFMEHVQILLKNISEDKKELFIALLAGIGFEGFEEEDENLKAFVREKKFDEQLFDNLIQINNIKYLKSIIKEENWNEKWEADFEPIKVYHPKTNLPFVFIRASFHKANSSFKYDLQVTPKMSFGTGHHATTYLMVANMSSINFKNKTVIDFGTGTGVLAILAEKMGAVKVLAIDNDEWSINNARENIEVNSCKNITLLQAETIAGGNTANIILANINLNTIKGNIAAIKNAASDGSIFLFSGIMLHDEEKIGAILKDAGLNIEGIFKKDKWLSIKAKN